MSNSTSDNIIGAIGTIFALFLIFVLPAAWATHVVVCFKVGNWGFLIAGALAFPVAIVHGFGIWFGAW